MSISSWNLPSWANTIFPRTTHAFHGVPADVFSRANGAEANVTWNVCGERVQCANISVPLDYHNTSDERTITIAVNRVEATDKANRKGAIFVNPGGPGSSGTDLVFAGGELASKFLEGQYDIVGFDPRGVLRSQPYVSCFDTLLQEAAFIKGCNAVLNLPTSVSALNSSDVKSDLTKQIAFFNASTFSLAQECYKRTGEAIGYVGTEAVARDIDFISQKIYGESEPINYWGISYGTVIGQYMVKTIPAKRLGKILIDGVVNADTWSKNPTDPIRHALRDTDKIFETFASTCIQAGPACPLNALHAFNTSSALVSKVDDTIDSLYFNPVPGYSLGFPAVASAANLRSFIFDALYSSSSWPQLGAVLSDVLQGNMTSLLALTTTQINDEQVGQPGDSAFSGYATVCADTHPYDAEHPPPSPSQLADIVLTSLRTHSRRSADQVLRFRLCDGWNKAGLSPHKTYYNGTFELANGTLTTPALILSNTLDPITPLANAKGAAKNFGNNGRLIQQVDGVGHTTLSQLSLCTGRVAHAYFVNGTIPSEELTFCNVDQKPFVPFNSSNVTDSVDRAWAQLVLALSH